MSIKYKLFLFTISIVFVILLISSSMQYYFIQNDFKEKLFSESNNDMPFVVKEFKDSITQVQSISFNFVKDSTVINTLNLISNYQDKTFYEGAIYDREKVNLLAHSENMLSFIDDYKVTLYDKDSDPLLTITNIDKQRIRTIYSYEDDKIIAQNVSNGMLTPTNEKIVQAKIAINHIDTYSIKIFENKMYLTYIQKVYKKRRNSNEHIGYVKFEKILTKKFLNNIGNRISSQLTIEYNGKQFGYRILLDKEDFNNLTDAEHHTHYVNEIKEKRNSYQHIDQFNFNKHQFFIVLTYSKDAITSFEENMGKSVIISGIISLILGFFMSIVFIQRNIMVYLSQLINNLLRLKNDKSFKPIDYSSDIPSEFKLISDEFNAISKALSLKIEFEAILNDISKHILQKHDNFIEPVTYILSKIGQYSKADKTFFITKDEKTQEIDLYHVWNKKENRVNSLEKDELFQCEIVLNIMGNKKILYFENLAEAPQEIKNYLYTIYGNDVKTIMCIPLIYNHKILGVFSIAFLEQVTPVQDELQSQYQTLEEIFVNLILRQKATQEVAFNNKMMFQQSKMAAMGEMIENIAHQWRQPLSMISTSASGIKFQKNMNILKDDIFEEALDNIVNTTEHLSSTIDDFRDFFSHDKEKTSLESSQIFNRAFKLLSAKLKNKQILLVQDIENCIIISLENELIHVLMNILNNAYDVLEDMDNMNEKLIIINASKKENTYHVTIQDNGGGINDTIIDRIFEPYFTTKHQAQGTGIGLYMSKEIIERKLLGKLDVTNNTFIYEDKEYTGAQFTIDIPIE